MMNTFVGFLRGINVGGRNILPMKELRALLEELGLEKVKSYIQSGNVVFQSAMGDTDSLSQEVRTTIKERYGFAPQVLFLHHEELRIAVASNPFPDGESEPKTIHLFFMASAAGSPDMAKLESLRTESERFKLVGQVFYLHAPDGIGRSKLAANIENSLGVPVTARNWRTVSKINSMAADLAV